ncbi:MAG TPA: DUF2062 domain-containing protein [Verrucomicrobiae bacterium]
MSIRRWLHEHSLKLLAIRDTPEAIAGGVAIGFFFGFMPLFGIKTISAIFLAWLTGSNILAAVIAGALHDLILPLMPAVYMWQYDIGYWLLSTPHHWPPPVYKLRLEGPAWHFWTTFLSIGKPLILGGLVFSTPAAAITFFVCRGIVARHHRKRQAQQMVVPEQESNPS